MDPFVHRLAIAREQHGGDDFVIGVEIEAAILGCDQRQEGEEVLGKQGRGVCGQARGQVRKPGHFHAVHVHDLIRFGERAVAALANRHVDNDRARLHRFHHLLGDEDRRGAAGNQGGRDHNVLLGDVAGRQFGLLGLVFRRHLLGITASGLSRLELFILDRDEFRAERGDLFLGSGTHIGCGDDRAEAARRGNGLKASDAYSHDKDLGRGDRAGSGHHHRHGAAVDLRTFND